MKALLITIRTIIVFWIMAFIDSFVPSLTVAGWWGLPYVMTVIVLGIVNICWAVSDFGVREQ